MTSSFHGSPAGGVYLPTGVVGGSPYFFDPDSTALRGYVKEPRRDESLSFDSAALAADVRDLRDAMSTLYAGYPELLRSAGSRGERFFWDWERDVGAAGARITFGEGILRPLLEIRRHIRDNHLFTWGWGRRLARHDDLVFSEYQARGTVGAFEAADVDFGDAAVLRDTARVSRVLSRHGVERLTTFSARSMAPALDVRCGGQVIRFERRASRARAADAQAAPYEWRTVGDATVIVVRTLSGSPQVNSVLERIAADYERHRKKSAVVVFDFRGNGGGNDAYVFDWIEKARGGPWSSPYTESHVAEAARACGEWNSLVIDQIRFERVDTPEAKAERDALLAKMGVDGADGTVAEVTNETSLYPGRVFAVIDSASGSSGETAPDELRVALGAMVVGERSAGFLEFGNARPWVMARTGVIWYFGSKRRHYEGPRDGVGIPVDVYLDGDLLEAPIDELVPMLKMLSKE